MALVGNYSVLSKNPGRALGGSSVAADRASWNKSGANRNRYSGAGFSNNFGHPLGYTPPGSWILSPKSGGIGSHRQIDGLGTVVAALLSVKTATASLSASGSVTNANLSLLSQVVAALAGTASVTNAELATTSALASTLSGSGSLGSPVLRLRVPLNSAMAGTGAISATQSGTASLSADISPFTVLSPESLAQSVWDFDRDNATIAQSMGDELKKAKIAAENSFAVSS